MHEFKMYQCDFCGTKYSEKLRCQECERGHKKPINVKSSKYISISNDATGYPQYVDVEMNNGKTVRYYKRKEVWEQ